MSKTADKEISIQRTVNASKELVFKAWTESRHLEKWMGPNGFTLTTQSLQFKEGGSWKYVMHGPDGKDYDNYIKYDKIIKNELITYTHGGDGSEFQTTVSLESEGPRTNVHLTSVFKTAEEKNKVVEEYGAIEGGEQTLARLDEYSQVLAQVADIEPFVIQRSFDAPISLMFKVWSDPEHLKHWMGPKGTRFKHSTLDFRVGGTYHYCILHPKDNQEMWGKIVYREISTPNRVVYLQSFSDSQQNITKHPMAPTWPLYMLTTVTLIESKGKTSLSLEWLPWKAKKEEIKIFDEARESMKQGWDGSLDVLADYIRTLK